MNEKPCNPARKQLKAWTKKQLDAAVRKLMDQGAIDSLIVEAKPAWTLPFQILIGKIRAHGQASDFVWFICGEVPTDYLEAAVAPTAREAARHFAMKWQLQAARLGSSGDQVPIGTGGEAGRGGQLADQAEALYSLVDESGLWWSE